MWTANTQAVEKAINSGASENRLGTKIPPSSLRATNVNIRFDFRNGNVFFYGQQSVEEVQQRLKNFVVANDRSEPVRVLKLKRCYPAGLVKCLVAEYGSNLHSIPKSCSATITAIEFNLRKHAIIIKVCKTMVLFLLLQRQTSGIKAAMSATME